MFVTGHIGKLGTGSADKCTPTTIYGMPIDARRLSWKLQIDGGVLIGHYGEEPEIIPTSGTPLSVYWWSALTDREIIVFDSHYGLYNPPYISYNYFDEIGAIAAYHATVKSLEDSAYMFAYMVTPNGDVYLFDQGGDVAPCGFNFVGNYGEPIACFCVAHWYYDNDLGDYRCKPAGYILNVDGDLYVIDGLNSMGCVHSHVTGLGSLLKPRKISAVSSPTSGTPPFIIAYSEPNWEGVQEGIVFSDEDGNLYKLEYTTKILIADGIPYPVLAYMAPDQDLGLDAHICYYAPLAKTLIGGRVTDWVLEGDTYVPIISDTTITECDKPFVADFLATYPYDTTFNCKYLIGIADEDATYTADVFPR